MEVESEITKKNDLKHNEIIGFIYHWTTNNKLIFELDSSCLTSDLILTRNDEFKLKIEKSKLSVNFFNLSFVLSIQLESIIENKLNGMFNVSFNLYFQGDSFKFQNENLTFSSEFNIMDEKIRSDLKPLIISMYINNEYLNDYNEFVDVL